MKKTLELREKIREEVISAKILAKTVDEAVDSILLSFSVSGSVADTAGRNCPFCGETCTEYSHKTSSTNHYPGFRAALVQKLLKKNEIIK